MKQKLFFLVFLIGIFFSFNFSVQAQRQVFKSGEVVDTEIQDFRLSEWNSDRSIYIIEFDVVNNLDLTQKNIHFALELFDNSKEQGKFLVDRMVGKDLINLAPNGLTRQRIQYNFPVSLEKEYELQLVLATDKGFEFERKVLGRISQKKAQGIFIDITQCQSKNGSNLNHIFKEINLSGENFLEIQCKNVKNLNLEDLTFIPKIKIRKEAKFGEILQEENLESQILSAENTGDFSFKIPVKNDEFFKHFGELVLTDQNGEFVSNKLYFNYNFQKKLENENLAINQENKTFFQKFTEFLMKNKIAFFVLISVLILVIILIFRGRFVKI